MKTKFKLIFASLFSILLFYCQGQENKIELEKRLQEGFKKSFQEIGVKIQDTVYIEKEILYVKMVKDSGYYIDKTTNHLLRSFLLFKYYEDMKAIDSVEISVTYVGLNDKETFYYPRSGIDKIYAKLYENQLFISLLPYLIRNTDANDIVNMDDTINELSKYVDGEKYNFKGFGFWEFIYDYTKNSCNLESDVHMNMNEVHHASTYPKFPTRPDLFEYVIKESKHYCKEKGNGSN